MQNIFDELQESFAKLKKRQLKLRLDEAVNYPEPDDPAVLAEPKVIQQLNQIQLGQSQDVGGLVFERRQKSDGTEALFIISGKDPRGQGAVHPVGHYEAGQFKPSYGKAGQLSTRGGWYKILKVIAGGMEEFRAEEQTPEEQVNVTDQYDTESVRRGFVAIKNGIRDLYDNNLFYNIQDRDLPWIGKSVAQPMSYIESTGSGKGLNEKLQFSSGFVREKAVDPDTGEESTSLTMGLTADPETVGDSLGQLGYTLDVMSKFLNKDTAQNVTKDHLRRVSNLVSIDRNLGIIVRQSIESDHFICIPKGESTFWDDIIDNYNIELENQGQYSSIIRTITAKGNDSGNLNNIRGKSVEKLLKVISLVKVNKDAAKNELLNLFAEYQEGLFEAFSVLDVFKEGGILDEENLEKSVLASEIKEVLEMEDISAQVPGVQDSLNRQATMESSKEAVKRLLLSINNLHKDTFFGSKPDAVIHTGDDIGVGRKADLQQIFTTKDKALAAAKHFGVSPTDLNLVPKPARTVMGPKDLQDYGISPDQEIFNIGISLKTYTKNSSTKMGEVSELSVLSNLASNEKFNSYIGKNLGFSDGSQKSISKTAQEIDKVLATVDQINDTSRGKITYSTIVDSIMNNAGHYGLENNKILNVVNGTNGKEKLDFTNKGSISSAVSRIRSYLYSSILDKKIKTKSGREFLAAQVASIACAEEELVTSIGFLDSKESFNQPNNKEIFKIMKDFIDGKVKAERSAFGYSFKFKDSSGKTLLSLKADRKKSKALDEDGLEYKKYKGIYSVQLNHSKKKASKKNEGFDEDLKKFLESQEILLKSIYNRTKN